jgi:preprotein translocase subunit SecY
MSECVTLVFESRSALKSAIEERRPIFVLNYKNRETARSLITSGMNIPGMNTPSVLEELLSALAHRAVASPSEFSVYFAQAAPVLTAIAAWLAAQNGRKVRVKIGDVEVEARTAQEIKSLLTDIKGFQKDKPDESEKGQE